MAGKHYQGYLPIPFDITRHFFYSPILKDYDNGKKLYDAAAKIALPTNIEQSDQFQRAIEFLRRVQAYERAKETACIDYHLTKLKEQSKQTNNPKLKTIFDKLEKSIQKRNIKDIETQQIQLIQEMSLIRSKIDLYMSNLNALKNPPKSLSDAQQNDFLVGNQTFIEKILVPQNKIEREIHDNIQAAAANFIETYKLNLTGIHFTALMVAISADFRAYLQENKKNLIMNTESVQNFLSYIEQENRYLQQIIKQPKQDPTKNSNEPDPLLIILDDIIKEFKIMFPDEKEKYITDLKQEKAKYIKQRQEKEDLLPKTENKNQAKKIQDDIKDLTKKINSIPNKISRITETQDEKFFRLHNETSHGDIQEIITTIIYRSFNVPGSAAVDTLGTIFLETRTDDIIPIFKQISNEMEVITSLHTKLFNISSDSNSSRKNNVQTDFSIKEYSEQYKTRNEKIKEILKNYKEHLETMSKEMDYSNIFITHESAKLYWDRKKNEAFSGREISIGDALGQIYSVNDELKFDEDILIHIIVNLSSATQTQLNPLEKYLSIFSGLLMFGDIYNMAVETAKFFEQQQKLDTNEIHTIHLYNIGEHFIPSSIVLENICQSFEQMSAQMSAQVEINLFTPKNIHEKSSEAAWQKASNDALKKTKIKIHFLKGLFDFIRTNNLFS